MNKLPQLPKQNRKKEATFGVWLKGYTEKHLPLESEAYELKQTQTNSIAFSEITPKQIAFGKSIKSPQGAWIRVQGLNGEPDYIYLVNARSFIVIKFPRIICWIDVDRLVEERDTSKRKSLTVDRAIKIASYIF